MIGGFVILFSIIISMLKTSNILYFLADFFAFFGVSKHLTLSLFSGFIEVTNGISFVSNLATFDTHYKIILSSFILGFGGFSVLLQVLSITSKAKISIKPYFIGKLLQAFFALVYTYIMI